MKKWTAILITLFLLVAAAGCTAGVSASTAETGDVQAQATAASETDAAALDAGSVAEALAGNQDSHAGSGDEAYDASAALPITFDGGTITAEGAGVSVAGSVVTIAAAGDYLLSGTLADGQVLVNTQDEGLVRLILAGVSITSSTSAAIHVASAEEVLIVLAEGSQNTLSDAAAYVYPAADVDEPNAALFSAADLTLSGSGSLTVNGNYNDGIASQDGLVITDGTITVSAVDDGLRGKDYIILSGGAVTVSAGGDGLKSDNEEEAERGYIAISGGSLDVTSAGDALQAVTDVLVSDGALTLTAGGGSASWAASDVSAKGIKGAAGVIIDGGTFTIDSADDALHSNGSLVINGGTFVLASGDDGMHADASIEINAGEIQISGSYEGIESAAITLNGGTIHIVSSDDGLNVSAGNDGSGTANPGGGPPGGQGPRQDAFASSSDNYLHINGGTIYVDARGDGLDINGAVAMTGGVLIVDGPTENMNGAIDYDMGFSMSGGWLVTAGSAGMAMAPDSSSSQNSLLVNFDNTLAAGTLVHIQNSAGESILTFAPARQYQSLTFSSPDLVSGETYTLFVGGSDSGSHADGVYTGGTYSGGSEVETFSVSSAVTMIGRGGFMGPGGGRP